MAPKTPLPASKRPRRYRTTRGMRRLSYAEAYGNRTTDSSRARVMELYGRTTPPTANIGGRRVEVGKGEAPRSISPVTGGGPKPPSPPSPQTRGGTAPGTMPRRQSPRSMPNQASGSGNTRIVGTVRRRRRRARPTGGALAPA